MAREARAPHPAFAEAAPAPPSLPAPRPAARGGCERGTAPPPCPRPPSARRHPTKSLSSRLPRAAPPPAGTTSPSSPGRATPRRGRRGGCWGSRERGGRQRPAVRGSGWPEGTPSPRVLGGSVCLNRCQWAPAAAGKASRTREGFSPAPPPPGFPEHQRLGAA